jgi:hypothetical protein
MTNQVIYLDLEDDFVSIRDRLDWATEQRVVLVLPDRGDLLTNYLDISLIRRHADNLKILIGLVTIDSRVKKQAKELGIPTFRSVEESEKRHRRWWRGRRQRVIPGQPSRLAESDRKEVKRRSIARPTWTKWLIRYSAIIIFLLTLAILFVAATYAIPTATITLKPKVRNLEVSKKIVADPQLASDNFSGVSVPGRVLVTVQEWEAEVGTTGQIEVADSPARGTVLFINDLIQGVTVPAGTRVSTSAANRIVFQTAETIEVPGAIGASADVKVVAIEPGPEGNVRSNLINRIEGPLALQLAVRNIEPTSGGESRTEAAVTQLDLDRLRSQVVQQLQVMALGEALDMLAPTEFLAKDSLRIVDIYHETYSHFPGEQTDSVALDIRAELQATAVDETQAAALVYDELVDRVLPGYELVPGTLEFDGGELLGADNEGRVIFEMVGRGRMSARLDLEDDLEQITGQQLGLATTYLFERLPLRDYPTVDVWPGWFERLPYLPIRISTNIDTTGE